MHDMFLCHLCKAEPSIVATFHFEHRRDDVTLSGALGMCTDSNSIILQTFFTVKLVGTINLNVLINYVLCMDYISHVHFYCDWDYQNIRQDDIGFRWL